MLKIPKIFKNKKQHLELVKTEKIEVKSLEHNEENFKDSLNAIPPTNQGQVSIQLAAVSPAGKELLVGFFVSNGLTKKIKCDNVSLVLIDSEMRILAKQSFDGDIIGEISGGKTKACVARFLPKNIYVQEIPKEGCQVCFDVS